jgi:nitric oxide reductase NorD protein
MRLPGADRGFADPGQWRRAMRIAVLRISLVEAARAAPVGPTAWAGRDRRARLERWLEQLLQRTWADVRIAALYPGARQDLFMLRAQSLRLLGRFPKGELRGLLHGLARASLQEAAFAAPSPGPGGLHELCALAATVARADAELACCSQIAAQLHTLLRTRFPGSRKTLRSLDLRVLPVPLPLPGPQSSARWRAATPGESLDTQGTDNKPAGHGPSQPASPGTSIGEARASDRPLSGSVGATDARANASGSAADAPDDPPEDDVPDATRPIDPAQLRSRYGVGAGEAVGVFLIDEWDCHGRQMLPAWCRLHEMRLRGPDQDLLGEVRERYPALARRILERFAALKPVSHRRVRGVADGEDLDLDGVIAAMVERRAGSASDQRAWVRRERRDRDVATALLLDMSASTSLSLPASAPGITPTPPPASTVSSASQGALLYGFYDDTPGLQPEAPRRRVIDVARDSLALMALGLATLGDDHAIYGFSGSGRQHVEFHIARDFDDPWRQRALGSALAAIEPRGSTRMGPAIRHAAARLARRPAPQRLLILVSDGYPQDIDYGPDRDDEGYGLQDTAHALRTAQRQGVATFCVTIDPGGHDYLKRMCAPESYRVIEDVQALPEALSEIYARLTSRA